MQMQALVPRGTVSEHADVSRPIKRILVPLDRSNLGERALPYVERLAKRLSAQVFLVHTTQASSGDPYVRLLAFAVAGEIQGRSSDREIERQSRAVEAAEEYVEQVAQSLRRAGIQTHAIGSYGPPADLIADLARFHRIDLIVMATHGRSGLSRWRFGSVTEQVLAASQISLITVRTVGARPTTLPETVQRILVLLTGDESAADVLRPVASIARAYDADVHILHVRAADSAPPAHNRILRAYLSNYLDWLQNQGIHVRVETSKGRPLEVLEQYLEHAPADLIAVARHNPSFLERFHQRIDLDLLRTSQVPVLIGRPGVFPEALHASPGRYVRR